jgi:nitrogen-specific signal transduction histidine kinase
MDAGFGVPAEKLDQLFNPFLTSKLERTGMGWRSASRSYNRMTAVCGLTLTRNQDRYFVSLYPLNVLRTKRRSCAIVNNVKVK